jgi:hypothetical protein
MGKQAVKLTGLVLLTAGLVGLASALLNLAFRDAILGTNSTGTPRFVRGPLTLNLLAALCAGIFLARAKPSIVDTVSVIVDGGIAILAAVVAFAVGHALSVTAAHFPEILSLQIAIGSGAVLGLSYAVETWRNE